MRRSRPRNLFATPTASRKIPHSGRWALLAYGYARHDTDPDSAFEAHRLGAKIARETGNRLLETYHTGNLSRLAARHRDPAETFDYITTSIRNYFNAGNYSSSTPGHGGAGELSRPGWDTMRPQRRSVVPPQQPGARSYFPEIDFTITHLREVLGDTDLRDLGACRCDHDQRRHRELRPRADRPRPRSTFAHG